MGRKYNKTYKKGKYLDSSLLNRNKYRNKYGYTKSQIADKSKFAKLTYPNKEPYLTEWKKDTRKIDILGIDTPPTKGQRVFNYKYRSKKRYGKKAGRENKTYRRYWKGRK